MPFFDKSLFKKPQNKLEGAAKLSKKAAANVPEELRTACPGCGALFLTSDLPDHSYVCTSCGLHFRINARIRLHLVADADSFAEHDEELQSKNLLDFPSYDKKLTASKLESGENEAVICGVCTISGYKTAVFAMEPSFMMGSMGTVVGEKITRLFEYALKERLPVIGFTVSGGARMQEGMLSLIQMAKISGAVKRHSDAGLLYVAVLTDPTTGGVTASFAMEGDIIIAEPGALIGFAGQRVIEQTLRQKLPSGFQRAEFNLERGFLDDVVDRRKHPQYLAKILMLHSAAEEGL